MPPWAFDFTGRCGEIDDRPVLIEEQLTEITDHKFGQRHVLTLARYMDDEQEIMVKIRHDLHPGNFHIRDPKKTRENAELDFLAEIRLVDEVSDIDSGPSYVAHVAQPQGETFPFPDGNVYFIIMTRVPGVNLNDIYHNLTDEQLESIRLQLARILEHMRMKGFLLTEQHPSLLQYDVGNDKLYIINYSFITFTDPNGRFPYVIDRDSPFVTAFGIWRHDKPGILESKHAQPYAPSVPERGAELPQKVNTKPVQGTKPQGKPIGPPGRGAGSQEKGARPPAQGAIGIGQGAGPQGQVTRLPQRPTPAQGAAGIGRGTGLQGQVTRLPQRPNLAQGSLIPKPKRPASSRKLPDDDDETLQLQENQKPRRN